MTHRRSEKFLVNNASWVRRLEFGSVSNVHKRIHQKLTIKVDNES